MRFYLDTNILIYLLRAERDELCPDVLSVISNYESIMLTSTVCVQELIHLFQIGKITLSKRNRDTDLEKVPKWLDDLGIRIVPVGVPHLQRLAGLPMFDDHRDPNDRLIVARVLGHSSTKVTRSTYARLLDDTVVRKMLEAERAIER